MKAGDLTAAASDRPDEAPDRRDTDESLRAERETADELIDTELSHKRVLSMAANLLSSTLIARNNTASRQKK